ncbi:MAG: type II toxin-antitoxin system VapC family toxin [Candidatus Sumerlaeota bacterium]|nr:type II toxin-antitoxin system VapC family toxin [Candidatus Sumerlaeota bacterium]
MCYMLDTNTCIELIRNHNKHILRRLASQKADDIGISSITLSELEYGVEKSSMRERNREALAHFLAAMTIEPYDQECAKHYGFIRGALERIGQKIGSLDFLIAAHALALNATLVTNNVREFHRVPFLKIEDWSHS